MPKEWLDYSIRPGQLGYWEWFLRPSFLCSPWVEAEGCWWQNSQRPHLRSLLSCPQASCCHGAPETKQVPQGGSAGRAQGNASPGSESA